MAYINNVNRVKAIRDQERHEYAFMKAMIEANKMVRKVNPSAKVLNVRAIRDIRAQWGKDLAVDNYKMSDWSRIASLLPSDASFDEVRNQFTDQNWVKSFLASSRDDYSRLIERGDFPVSIVDPEVVASNVLPEGITAPFVVTKSGSLREIDAPDTVLYRVDGQTALGVAQPSVPLAGPDVDSSSLTSQMEALIESTDHFVGWNGIDGEEQAPGLRHVLGAYLTQADAAVISRLIDPKATFNREMVYRSVDLLRHLRSEGIEFDAVPAMNERENQFEARLQGPDNTKIRIFDPTDNGAYIGRVFNKHNLYHVTRNMNPRLGATTDQQWTTQDTFAVLDYISGRRDGRILKNVNKDSSSLFVDGMTKGTYIHVSPHANRYASVTFESETQAQEFIEESLMEARSYVDRELHFDDLVERIADRVQGNEAVSVDDLISLQDMSVSELQERLIDDLELILDARENGYLDMLQGTKLNSVPHVDFDFEADDVELRLYNTVMTDFVGSYENGFNPAFVSDVVRDSQRSNMRDAMMAALKKTHYDLDKLQGNDFATNVIKDKLIEFDPSTGKTIDDVQHPMIKAAMQRVSDNLSNSMMRGADGGQPKVLIDDKGVIFWEATRMLNGKKDANNQHQRQLISGEIGQVMVPDGNNIIKTDFASGENYGLVPGYTGYFSFEGEYSDNRMDRFRVKGFERTLIEQIDSVVRRQITQPFVPALNNIAPDLDSSALNSLYHGDVYGTRVDMDFVENSELKPEVTEAILHTLSNRVRFENQYSEYATTSAQTREEMKRDAGHEDEAAFSYWKAVGEKNMRILHEDSANYIDMTMTGTGKTQGLVWYLTDGAKINPDGSVTPSAGMLNEHGEMVPDRTALQKLDYFNESEKNAWDRNQMASNQLLTALKVDEGVNATLMSFGGWTFDDSYAVSAEFAERNYVLGVEPNDASMAELHETLGQLLDSVKYGGEIPDEMVASSKWSKEVLTEGLHRMWAIENLNSELSPIYSEDEIDEMTEMKELYDKLAAFEEEHGRFRPLQRGDKISDFGGNKGTIGIVIDRHMDPAEAEAQGLEKEVAFMKENPTLDVIGAPYSMLSRHNAGVVSELMNGEVTDSYDPESGEILPGAIGKMNFIITNLTVDHKTHAYSEEDIAEGKGRKASGQLAWALMSKDANHILSEIYGRNDTAWSTFREYLIVTGLDMQADGTLKVGYNPQGAELRNTFNFDPAVSSDEFLGQIRDQGGFLKLPFDVENRAGEKIDELPVLSASLRKDTELIDGKMRRSDYTNSYLKIYDAMLEHENAQVKAKVVKDEETGKRKRIFVEATEADKQKAFDTMKATVQAEYNKIQDEIIDRQFNGSHNGKHSFIRDKIMGKRMENSATGVAIVDPRLNIGEAGMNADMMKALNVKEGDTVMAWRDPVLRDGAVRAFTVVQDDTVHGISINPIADKSHDMDFDGDTMGIVKLSDPRAIKELQEKFGHSANMFDLGSGKENDLYFQSGMDLATAEAKALAQGDVAALALKDKAIEQANSTDDRVKRQAVRTLTDYSHKMFREHGFCGDYVNLQNRDTVEASFTAMVNKGAKGSPGKLHELMEYFDGHKDGKDARDIQYATGVKSDDTGLAGGFSQKLMAAFRDKDIKPALELTYLITQGTLQIKHDPDQADKINKELSTSLNQLYSGKHADGKKGNLHRNQFVKQMSEAMGDRLGVDFNQQYLEDVADMMCDDKKVIRSIKEIAATQGSPLDQVAYGGGFASLRALAQNERSLLEGKRTQMFAPTSMREATPETMLVKKDTLDRTLEQDIKSALQESSHVSDVVTDYARTSAQSVHQSVVTMQQDIDPVDEGPEP